MERAKKKKNVFKFKHRLSNGEIRDVEVYSGPINLNNQELLFSVVHDSQERVELESRYRRNKVYFDNLFNNSSEAIAIVDEDFKILDVNDSFERVFQYNLNEVRKRSYRSTM